MTLKPSKYDCLVQYGIHTYTYMNELHFDIGLYHLFVRLAIDDLPEKNTGLSAPSYPGS